MASSSSFLLIGIRIRNDILFLLFFVWKLDEFSDRGWKILNFLVYVSFYSVVKTVKSRPYLIMFMFFSDVFPHHVKHCSTNKTVFNATWKQKWTRIGQQSTHYLTVGCTWSRTDMLIYKFKERMIKIMIHLRLKSCSVKILLLLT